ncbi:MAG: hypothetical protein ACHQ49_01000 [Elusimicrobiota bacterium]
MRIVSIVLVAGVFAAIAACKKSSSSSAAAPANGGGIVVSTGTWSYVLTASVPLPSNPGAKSCVPPNATGTTVVSSTGSFSFTFSGLTCDACTMSGAIGGIVVPTGVTGAVAAVIVGTGCSSEQPTPNPAAMTGTCTSASCSVGLSATDSFAVSYTLTPP